MRQLFAQTDSIGKDEYFMLCFFFSCSFQTLCMLQCFYSKIVLAYTFHKQNKNEVASNLPCNHTCPQ